MEIFNFFCYVNLIRLCCFIPELNVTGTALPTRNSAKDKARLEESMILQKLREEGLISKPQAEKSGGVSFDIFDMTSATKLPALPSIRLAKLEKRRKKKRALTEDEIQEKLQRAEQRRKVRFYYYYYFNFFCLHQTQNQEEICLKVHCMWKSSMKNCSSDISSLATVISQP